MLDSDSGFVRVLVNRLEGMGWQYRRLEAAPRVEEFVAMRVNALVVDLALLGPAGLGVPREAHRGHAGPGRGGLHRALDRRPARARAADGRRRLGHQALPPRGGAGARGGGGAPPQAGLGAGRRGARGGRRPRDPRRPVPGLRRTVAAWTSPGASSRCIQLLAHAEGKVLQREEIYQQVWGYAMAHGDRSVDVFIRKVRQKLEGASPGLEVHPHPLRRGLPLRPGAARAAGHRGQGVPEPAARCERRPAKQSRAGLTLAAGGRVACDRGGRGLRHCHTPSRVQAPNGRGHRGRLAVRSTRAAS